MQAGPIILVVEDSPEVAETLRELLEREGYAYEHAADGKQALAAVRRRPPDLILLDRMLPHVSGDEVLRRLRGDARCRHVPIIMLTGKSDEDDQLVGFALGADDYVSKPFSSKVLLARIAARLRDAAPADEESEAAVLGSVELDRRQPRVFVNKAAIPLTTAEYRLLAALIAAGVHDTMIGGGVEHMGHLPFAAGMQTQQEFGFAFTPELMAKHNIVGQGLGAEMIADQWEIPRSELDELAVRSHKLAHQATEEGRFEREIVPMTVDGQTPGSWSGRWAACVARWAVPPAAFRRSAKAATHSARHTPRGHPPERDSVRTADWGSTHNPGPAHAGTRP